MTSRCDHIHELLVAEATRGGSWSESVAAHLEGCEACSAWAKRLQLHRRALLELRPVPAPAGLEERVRRGFDAEGRVRRAASQLATLSRLEAPRTLDGKVVAAANGGVRQDRAACELSLLDTHRAPRELDRRIDSVFSALREDGILPPPAAPQELEERVDHDLRDLPAALTRRFTGKLERLTAPPLLARRVDEALPHRRATGRLLSFRRWSIVAGAAAVAGVALWIGFQNTGGSGPLVPAPFSERSVEIVHVEELSGFSPAVKSLADSVSGGAYRTLASLPQEALETGVAAPRPEPARGGTHGASANGRPTGGSPTGGSPTGGSPTGGSPTGGSPTGGSPTGGSSAATPPSGSPGGASAPASSAGAGTVANGSLGSTTGPPFLDLVPDAPFVTAYRGTRHVLERLETNGQSVDFQVRELVASDGQGSFTIEVEDVESPPLPPAEVAQHKLLQSYHVGFSYRYRDFRIRDLRRFWQSYLVLDTGSVEDVAGRACAVLEVSRHDGKGERFTLHVDPTTGLVMEEEERRPDGTILRQVWFETFQLDADISDLQLSGGPSQWVGFDPDQPGVVGFELLRPTAPPSGFRFDSAGIRQGADPSGATWVRFVYGDGEECVFFMHSDESLWPGDPEILGPTNDRIWIVHFGAWTVAEGRIDGRHTLVMGKVDEQELLLMMQSALE